MDKIAKGLGAERKGKVQFEGPSMFVSTQRIMEDLFTEVHSLLKERKYDECDVLLQEFDVTEHPPIVAVGLLRAAFAVKSKLPAWDGLLERTQSLGGDMERLLRGLEKA